MEKQQKSFKEKVLEVIFIGAQKYKQFFLDYEYQISSAGFSENKFYVISATKSNFLHLTGVNTNLTATQFFDKALNKTLSVDDFDFCKKGQTEKDVKGCVRSKMKILPDIEKILSDTTLVEEKFVKNKVSCTFAASENSFTLGFISVPKCRPKTLLKGNKLKNPCKIDSIKRRKIGEKEFVEFELK